MAQEVLKRMTSQVEKSHNNFWNEKDKNDSTQECKNTGTELKIEDVFLNSEYLKLHSGNLSSLSFCSGDNGENQWTLHSSLRRKPFNLVSRTNELTKSDTAVADEEVLGNFKKQMGKGSWSEEKKSFSPDKDLVSLITEQMFSAERELQITRTHLVETVSKLNQRDFEIIQLHEKIRMLQNSSKLDSSNVVADEKKTDEFTSTNYEDYQKLITASEKLKKQVKDMEEFLRDYGLTWVGDKEVNKRPDFDGIIKAFQRLNAMASQPKIIQTTLGAKFELPRGIPIIFYLNGFLLKGEDFREFGQVSTSLFLQDVEDGYFPSELQNEYPEGVPFEVFDKRNEVYKPASKAQVFQGHGNRLGSAFDGKQTSLVYLEPVKFNNKYETLSSSSPTKYDKHFSKKYQKKCHASASSQSAQHFGKQISEIQKLLSRNSPEIIETDNKINVKIRYGSGETEMFILKIPEAKKMSTFQRLLQEKLCEKFHEECLVDCNSNTRSTDFEVHVYGSSPFRLSENLEKYPVDCGISHNCVINVTEI